MRDTVEVWEIVEVDVILLVVVLVLRVEVGLVVEGDGVVVVCVVLLLLLLIVFVLLLCPEALVEFVPMLGGLMLTVTLLTGAFLSCEIWILCHLPD